MTTETKKPSYLTRNFHLMLLIGQGIGISASTVIPNNATQVGALGYMVCYVLISIFLGIPLMYMELIIGQFTGLNSLEVWKVRPFLSHVGYMLILWQFIILCLNQIVAAFVIHFLFISFEYPRPYYSCGPWAGANCNVIATNYTINIDCIKSGPRYPYCQKLYYTLPEIQYYRSIAGEKIKGVHVDWKLIPPSMVACTMIYLSCFKGKRSLRWFLAVLTFYPAFGFILLFLGSLLQKGILSYFHDAMDLELEKFFVNFNIIDVVQIVIYTMALGSGLIINVGASCSFRAPCYANTVLTTAASIFFHILFVCTVAMMTCPYAHEHIMSAEQISNLPISDIFEKVPILLREYDNNYFWAVIAFSSYACITVRTSIIIYYNLLEIFSKKNETISKYPGVTTFVTSVFIFCITTPFLGNSVKHLLSSMYRRCSQLVSTSFVIIECTVFVLWYGLDRFCEDVHFMQGIRPKNYMKFAWIVSIFGLIYCVFQSLWNILSISELHLKAGLWLLVVETLYVVLPAVVKLLVAAYRKDLAAMVHLTAAWKPRSELLQRSRAMFTAQAMTKEYLYRQYHLQAGILARQQRANRTREITTV